MRIIGGKLRSRKFNAPLGLATRPTGDRAKVALFNILQGRLEGAQVLDAFAGSGALAFEAVSRGAAMAVLFEHDGGVAALLRENASKLGLSELIDVWRGDFLADVSRINGVLFDIVFLDPPYTAGLMEKAVEISAGLLAPGGIVVAEHSEGLHLPETINGLVRTDSRKYGVAVFSFYQRQADQ